MTGNGVIEICSSPDSSSSILNGKTTIIISGQVDQEFNSWKAVTLVIESLQDTWYQTYVLPLRLNNQPVYIRYGVVNGGQSVYSAWEKHIIIFCDQTPTTSLSPGSTGVTSYRVMITTVDMLYFLDVGDRVIVRKGSPSDIVASIAQGASLETDIEATQNSQYTLYQVGQTDYAFIIDRLIPRALNPRGYGDYKIFITNNKLRFATLDYNISKIVPVVYTSALGPTFCFDFRFVDQTWKQIAKGAAGITSAVGSPLVSGKVDIATNDPNSTIRFADKTIQPTPASEFNKLMGRHKGDNPITEIQAQAQNAYSKARNQQCTAEFKISQNPFLTLAAIIDIQARTTFDYAGRYVICKAKHVFESGVFTSTYHGMRDSITGQYANNPTLAVDYTQGNQPFGGSSANTIGTPPRLNQTSDISATTSFQTVTRSVEVVT